MKFIDYEFTEMQEWLNENDYGHQISENEIICPICLKAKPVDVFTEEHIIPASIGGKTKTITCEECNSQCGYQYDYALSKFIEQQKLFINESKNKVKLFTEKTVINATLTGKKSAFTLDFSPKNNNPNSIQEFCTMLKEGLEKFEIKQSSKWSPKTISKAILKIAHLMSLPKEKYKFVLM
jgi:hypothetical protein